MNTLTQPERSMVIQAFLTVTEARSGLSEEVRQVSVVGLNRLLAHTIAIRDLYKKSSWQTSGVGYYQLYFLLERNHGEQQSLADALAARIHALGGVALALASDVVAESPLAHGPSGIESSVHQLVRLIDAHEFILLQARPLSRDAWSRGDDVTSNLIISGILSVNELQSGSLRRFLVSQGGGY